MKGGFWGGIRVENHADLRRNWQSRIRDAGLSIPLLSGRVNDGAGGGKNNHADLRGRGQFNRLMRATRYFERICSLAMICLAGGSLHITPRMAAIAR